MNYDLIFGGMIGFMSGLAMGVCIGYLIWGGYTKK
jgi:hypothetical protein